MIVVIDYDAGNLKNVSKAFESLGEEVRISRDSNDFEKASHIVLPGVGSFGHGMNSLHEYGLIRPILQQIKKGKPFLGICLGMQMLFESGNENGIMEGLGIMHGCVQRFQVEEKIPHVGWNEISVLKESILQDGSEVYFVHSYHACNVDREDVLCTTDYGAVFVSGVQRGNVIGLQFHPERSGAVGIEILRKFLQLKA